MKLKFLTNLKLFKQINKNNDIIFYLEYDSDFNHMSHIINLFVKEKKKF